MVDAATFPVSAPALTVAVTTLIAYAGQEASAAAVFDEAVGADGGERHHLAAVLIQQENGLSFLVSVFRCRADLDAWERSSAHRAMITSFDSHSWRQLCAVERSAVRVDVPSDESGPKWKLLVSTWIVIYPLLLAINLVLTGLLPGLSLALRLAVSSLSLSVAMTWLVTPWLHRTTRTWRLRSQQASVRGPAGVG